MYTKIIIRNFKLTSLLYAIYKVNDVNVALKTPKIIDIKLPVEVVKCVFKKRDGNKRRIIFLMIVVPCCNTMIFVGSYNFSFRRFSILKTVNFTNYDFS